MKSFVTVWTELAGLRRNLREMALNLRFPIKMTLTGAKGTVLISVIRMELTIYGGGLGYPLARHALSSLVSILNLISYTYLHVCKGGCLYVWITVPVCK